MSIIVKGFRRKEKAKKMNEQIQVSEFKLEQYINTDGLSAEMLDTILDYLLTLRVSESTKELYLQRLRKFGLFLMKNGIRRFTNAKTTDILRFLASYKDNTKNSYMITLKPFYRDFLNKTELAKGLKYYSLELEPIVPSDVLTPEEVIAIANEAGKRKDMHKTIILALFESCARVNELLHLKKGDVKFQSVLGRTLGTRRRKLIATLYFKRAKGKIKKQPVTLIMFAGELKRYVNNHHGDSQDWLFPSPYDSNNPLSKDSVAYNLWNAGTRIGVKKRLNPHWLRHSGLSFFANNKNYNEQLLMWRAGWSNTRMCERYIHSGAELEAKAYAERMGYVIEGEKPERLIVPKTCEHCQGLNPATNSNCDFCGMPLDAKAYKKEIEKRRRVQELYENLDSISAKKINKKQKAELGRHIEVMMQLVEKGRDDLAEQYIEKLLGNWTKTFLTD